MDISLNSDISSSFDTNFTFDSEISEIDEKTNCLASKIIPHDMLFDSFNRGINKAVNVSGSYQLEDPVVKLEKACEEARTSDIHHPSVLYHLFYNTNIEEFESLIKYLEQQNVSMNVALFSFMKLLSDEDTLETTCSVISNDHQKKVIQLFIDRGAKINEKVSENIPESIVEAMVLDFDYIDGLPGLYDCLDDPFSVKIFYEGKDRSVLDLFYHFYKGNNREDIGLFFQNYIHVYMKGQNFSEEVLRQVFDAMETSDCETLRTLIRQHKIDPNKYYPANPENLIPIGLDIQGDTFDELGFFETLEEDDDDDDEEEFIFITPKVFEVFIQEGLNISDDMGFFPTAEMPLGKYVFYKTQDFAYLRLLHKYGYDFNVASNETSCILFEILAHAFDTGFEDHNIFAQEALRFLKELLDADAIDLDILYDIKDPSSDENSPKTIKKNFLDCLIQIQNFCLESSEYYQQAVELVQ